MGNNLATFIFFILLFVISYFGYVYFSRFFYLFSSYKLLFLSKNKYYLSFLFLFLAFLVLIIGIFDPKWGEKQVKNELNGLDVVFVLDVSKSMNALFYNDDKYYYSGLDSAKKIMSDFVGKHLNDRFGLVVFAGDAVSASPLTTDHSTFLTFLQSVDYRNLNEQGTNFEKAIKLGVDRFDFSEDIARAMIVLSDGGDSDYNPDFSYIEDTLKDKNITTFVIGIGNDIGSKIPIEVFGNTINYQTYNGKEVIIKINEDNLEKLAKSISGEYISTRDISFIDKNIEKLEKSVLKVGDVTEKQSAIIYLAMASFVFFVLYLLFSFVKFRKNEK